MKGIPYASAVESLIYAQICTHLDITYAIGKIGSYMCNPEINYWKTAKKVMWYLQRTKNHMLTYRKSDQLQLVIYTNSDYGGCI